MYLAETTPIADHVVKCLPLVNSAELPLFNSAELPLFKNAEPGSRDWT
jgi:hypothetical protein